MATLAELTARLNALREQRASGIRSIGSGTDQVQYASDSEMANAVRDLERQIAALTTGGTVSTIRFTTSKGI